MTYTVKIWWYEARLGLAVSSPSFQTSMADTVNRSRTRCDQRRGIEGWLEYHAPASHSLDFAASVFFYVFGHWRSDFNSRFVKTDADARYNLIGLTLTWHLTLILKQKAKIKCIWTRASEFRITGLAVTLSFRDNWGHFFAAPSSILVNGVWRRPNLIPAWCLLSDPLVSEKQQDNDTNNTDH